MNRWRKFFAVLLRGQAPDRPDDALSAEFEAAQVRLHNAQSDFARVVREVLDQNERLRSRNAEHRQNPRA